MKKITLCLIIILALIIVPGAVFATAVTTDEQFITTVEEGTAVEINKDMTIKLEKDITLTNKITIGVWGGTKATATIDLNGHTIKLNGSSAYFYVQNTGTLVIEDSVGTGLITNAGASSSSQYLIQVKGECKINGGTIENTLSSKNALFLQGETKVAAGTLNGGIIKNSCTGSGRAVSVGKGAFTMNGGKIENKAAGSDGLVPAIQGGKIIITGGIIESAGTGIQSSNENVKIIGGTIKAGWFGLHTSNVTINPAEDKIVKIIVPTPETERAAALMLTYNKLKTGEGNEIYGGNFEAPMFMEKDYVCYPDNMKVYGGLFTHEVESQYIASGYVINKENDNYEVKLNTPNIDDEDIKEDDEVEMGVVPEIREQLKEILKKEIDENKAIQDALLEGKTVKIHVQMEKIEEKDVKEEELKAIKETSKEKKIVKFYDINLAVKADGILIDTISETSKKLKFKVLIPEELIKDGRAFFMYRYHDGKNGEEVEEIMGEIDKDNYFIFESDRFSTYVLAYEDKIEEPSEGGEGTTEPEQKLEEDKKDEVEEDKKDEIIKENKNDKDVPQTGDNVIIYAILLVISMAGIAISIKMKK